jgi:hypothetical protein
LKSLIAQYASAKLVDPSEKKSVTLSVFKHYIHKTEISSVSKIILIPQENLEILRKKQWKKTQDL